MLTRACMVKQQTYCLLFLLYTSRRRTKIGPLKAGGIVQASVTNVCYQKAAWLQLIIVLQLLFNKPGPKGYMRYSASIVISRGCISGFLGMDISKTPSLNLALIFSLSTSVGREIVRE